MISNLSPLVQAGLGTLFTWSLTAAGAAVVVIFSGSQMKLLHASLGFAAGVMLSASYWSLLSPAIEMAEQSNYYGVNGEYAFLPVTVGFLFGGLFVYLTDLLISSFGICVPQLLLVVQKDEHKQIKKDILMQGNTEQHMALGQEDSHDADENNFELGNFKGTATESHCRSLFTNSDPSNLNQRDRHGNSAFSTTGLGIPRPRSFGKNCPKPNKNKRPASIAQGLNVYENSKDPISNKEEQTELTSDSQAALTGNEHSSDKWKRIVLLIIAITVHNIPEGLAVGVGFGAIGSTPSATFESARNLAIGIGIQNFPEGLAVSLPLKAFGFSLWKSFWYGQLSGMVEPIFGILGALAVSMARPLLPYALSFAAGAMIYVVVDDIIPEASSGGRGKLATSATILGFVVMMALDVGLG